MLSVENNTLIVQAHKVVYVLHEAEITKLLQTDHRLWAAAIKRGKYYRRAERNMTRRVPHHDPYKGREPT